MVLRVALIAFAAIFDSTSHAADLPRCLKKIELVQGQELFARLAYAETLAANCREENSEIIPVIVRVIQNRINARKGNIPSVVFEENQFASSLHKYKESRFKDFLCPQDSSLWNKIWDEIHTKKKSNIPPDAFHYYLFKHSKRFKPPAWAEGPRHYAPVKLDVSIEANLCIRAYVNPLWK